ncbi:MAG TPA: bifunctional [glutamine synthetase] adenylyltransferase/[glutamine synthetase]-adenylyl-L-tyrosine phosphorylase [Mycobacteriales bacterium]
MTVGPGDRPRETLVRLGFREGAGAVLDRLGASEAVVEALAAAADPQLALHALAAVVDAAPDGRDLLRTLDAQEGARRRTTLVLGASIALGEHLVRHPADWHVLCDDEVAASRPSAYGLRRTLLQAVGAPPDDPLPWGSGGSTARAAGPETADALRAAYRRQQLLLAARDLTGLLVDDVAAELADLADAALEAALAVAAAGVPAGAAPARLAVIAMGKCGGHELNYSSDVDVVFVAAPLAGHDEQPALRTATALAEGLIRVCGESGPDGALFPVDPNLRPEGRMGPLVRTLASHRAYYERWARTWEFQALLKARPAAGDLELGRAYCDEIAPLVWSAASRPSFVVDVQAMRRRVEQSVRPQDADRQLKLGPGGLRDVEFAVQLLQLVHGRTDPSLRSASTLDALAALRDGGYVGRGDAFELGDSYRWLRWVEHRLQLWRLRRTHVIPGDPEALRRLARTTDLRTADEFTAELRRRTTSVRRLHDKLFYRPLLAAVARLPDDVARLSPDKARDLLTALGFADPERALQHLAALTAGVSRTAAIQRTLLPVMVDTFASSADPDGGLLAFRQVSEALGRTPWYLKLLRDEGQAAERLAFVLGTSRYASNLLQRAPDGIRILADDEALAPRERVDVEGAMAAVASRAADSEAAVLACRALRRVELLRIAAADLFGHVDVTEVGRALTATASATIATTLDVARRAVADRMGGPVPLDIAIIALGRLGGAEIGYGSDADVVFVYDPHPGADEQAAATAARDIAAEVRRLLAVPAPDPAIGLDAGLRPEGKQGPLVRSLAAYRGYHARWSSVWEAQALLRAAPLAGDGPLSDRFFVQVADLARYPRHFGDDQAEEVRRLKRRMETERVKPESRRRDLKLGPGGLSDVEWTVQLLQLRHGYERTELRVTGTLPALDAAVAAGLLAAADAGVLRAAWTGAARARNAITLVTGKTDDVLPEEGSKELEGVARLMHYPPLGGTDLLADLRASFDAAREVTERAFYAAG